MSAKNLAAALERMRAETASDGITSVRCRQYVEQLMSLGASRRHAIELVESMVASSAVAALALLRAS